jgi:hypothetical protein
MWDAVTSVDQHHDPVIFEGLEPEVVVVTNAGPATIQVKGWKQTAPSREASPLICLELRPGNMRSVEAVLIRVNIMEARFVGESQHAAVAWRVKK